MPKRALRRTVNATTGTLNRVNAGFRDVQNALAVPVLTAAGGPAGALAGGVATQLNDTMYSVTMAGPNLARRSVGLPPLKRYKYGEAFGLDVTNLATTFAVGEVKKRSPKMVKG